MRGLDWNLIQYNWCPYRKGKFGHRDQLHINSTAPQPSTGDIYWPFQTIKLFWMPDKIRKEDFPKANI